MSWLYWSLRESTSFYDSENEDTSFLNHFNFNGSSTVHPRKTAILISPPKQDSMVGTLEVAHNGGPDDISPSHGNSL